jgi:hypothetical protein
MSDYQDDEIYEGDDDSQESEGGYDDGSEEDEESSSEEHEGSVSNESGHEDSPSIDIKGETRHTVDDEDC